MRFNPVSFLGRLFESKKFLMVFSLVCAVIFWLTIDISENPSRNVTVSDVAITVKNQTDDNEKILMPVGEYINKVSVTVSGPGYIVSTVDKDDILVSVSSYAEVTKPGKHYLTLTATVSTGGCSVVKIEPSYIEVVYDYDTTADVPVEVDTSNFPKDVIDSAPDCEIYKSSLKSNSDNTKEIEFLNIKGPSEVVNSITKVVATPVLPSDVTLQTQNFNCELVFYDAEGKAVDSSNLQYNTDTYVRIVVYKTADVALVPTFSNLPSYYGQANSMPQYTLNVYNDTQRNKEIVTKVKIKGPVDTVAGLIQTGLNLSPIDFSKVTPKNTSFNVSFLLPEGVEIVDGTEEITVALQLGTLTTKTLTISPDKVKFLNLQSGLNATSSYKRNIKVIICGRSAVLKKITADKISVTVDCQGITTATVETKAVKVDLSAEYEAWVNLVEPAEISVEVK